MLPSLYQTRIEKIDGLYVLRDDLLPGGTKRRALVEWLPRLGLTHFIYAGSVYGSGGWALAEACRELGFDCTLALAKSGYRPHWLGLIDCEIQWFEPQPVVQIYNFFDQKRGLLPLGFDDPGFTSSLMRVFQEMNLAQTEIWMSCVSGTLVRCATAAWPDKTIKAVCVARHHGDPGGAEKFGAQEKYHQPARLPPPYPSNAFSDAKLWSFARRFATKDALIWNTSG